MILHLCLITHSGCITLLCAIGGGGSSCAQAAVIDAEIFKAAAEVASQSAARQSGQHSVEPTEPRSETHPSPALVAEGRLPSPVSTELSPPLSVEDNSSQRWLLQARDEFSAGNYQQARLHAYPLTRVAAQRIPAWLIAGLSSCRLGDVPAASAAYVQVRAANPALSMQIADACEQNGASLSQSAGSRVPAIKR